jgi:transposase InsO family protein
VKYAWIEEHQQQFLVITMCRVLEISRSGFYAWRKAGPSVRSTVDLALRGAIVRFHAQHRDAPGALKTWIGLNREGIRCGKHTVARLRKLDNIEARRKSRFRVMHAHQHTEPAAPDLVKRAFIVPHPNQVWVSDMTSVRTREGWLHLAIVLDLYARLVVGWAMDVTQAATLPIAALKMAIAQRRPGAGLICHTDQGTVYGCTSYRAVLAEHALLPSMSRRGNCHDNAVVESFFSSLKNEVTHERMYATREEARRVISDYITVYYNHMRLHQTLGYRTPAEVEAEYKVLH